MCDSIRLDYVEGSLRVHTHSKCGRGWPDYEKNRGRSQPHLYPQARQPIGFGRINIETTPMMNPARVGMTNLVIPTHQTQPHEHMPNRSTINIHCPDNYRNKLARVQVHLYWRCKLAVNKLASSIGSKPMQGNPQTDD